jgi:hypothetical protein
LSIQGRTIPLCSILDHDGVVPLGERRYRRPVDWNSIERSDHSCTSTRTDHSLKRHEVGRKSVRVDIVKTDTHVGSNCTAGNIETRKCGKGYRRSGIDPTTCHAERESQRLGARSAEQDLGCTKLFLK